MPTSVSSSAPVSLVSSAGPGRAVVTGQKSSQSLYDFDLATYDTGDTFDQSLSKGFIEIWSLPSRISARRDLAGS